jgi:hypothetical protein
MTEIELIVREAEIRRESAMAILMHAVRDLQKHGNPKTRRGVECGPGALIIELMWAVNESDDGLHFDIDRARENARRDV